MNKNINKTNEFRARKQLEMENLVHSRNHILLEGTYVNNTSRFLVYCPIHCRTHNTSLFNYKKSKGGMICCSKPLIHPRMSPTKSSNCLNPLSEKQKQTQDQTIEKAQRNNHRILDGVYQNRFSSLKVLCEKHNVVQETNYYNYNRCLAGLACCKNVKREARGGQVRDWRRTREGVYWRNRVLQVWDYKCAITGKTINETPLVCHHLFNASRGLKFAYSVENGIVLSEDLHEKFHIQYGYTNNNMEQFLDYLLELKNSAVYDSVKIDSLFYFLQNRKEEVLLTLDL